MERLTSRVGLKRLIVTAACLVMWRLLFQIPVVDVSGLYMYRRLLAASGLLPLIGPESIPFEHYSVGDIGIGPYIAALVIISLARYVSRRLRATSLERWGVAAAVAISFAGAYGWTSLMQSAGAFSSQLDWATRMAVCLQLAGGTAITILLAHTLDEQGLGFGYGAFLLFALGPFTDQSYRLGDSVRILNLEHMLAPAVVWAAFFVTIVVAGVALLLAVRRVQPPDTSKSRSRPKAVELRFLTSGVLRPPQLAFAILSLPALLAPYYSPTSPIWNIVNAMSPFGFNRAISVAFVVVEFALVVFFAWLVAASDWALMRSSSHLRGHVLRLGFLSGFAIAVLVVIAPIVNYVIDLRAGSLIPLDAADTMLLVAVVFLIVRALEGHPVLAPLNASPTGIP